MEKTYIISKEQYLAAKASWAAMTQRSASDHIIYNALRSLPLDRGFTDKKGQDKPWQAFNNALYDAKCETRMDNPFAGTDWAERGEQSMANKKKAFSTKFGTELTEAISDVIKQGALK